ncbi:ABC transporter substrate-binding protein [Sphingomicrobium sp. XHP0235]|uniref:ABC transporter substrate-binding protein n=1 Tax=Sphingomicrobium aquimarinum TaxID=3133971 RepID=UPI0031FEB9BE
MSVSSLLAAATLRIASLDLCADEYALALAPQGNVVSVSHLGANPAEHALSDRARGIHRNNGSLSDIARLKPDLVLVSRPLSSGGARLARRLGIRIHALSNTPTPDAVRSQVLEVGRLVGGTRAAQRWVQRYDRLAAEPPETIRALYLSHSGNNVGALNSAWIAMAGIEPLEIAPGRGHVEQIVRARPRHILESRYRADNWHRGGDWQNHPLVRTLDVPRYSIDGRPFSCGRIAMLGAVEALKAQRR